MLQWGTCVKEVEIRAVIGCARECGSRHFRRIDWLIDSTDRAKQPHIRIGAVSEDRHERCRVMCSLYWNQRAYERTKRTDCHYIGRDWRVIG